MELSYCSHQANTPKAKTNRLNDRLVGRAKFGLKFKSRGLMKPHLLADSLIELLKLKERQG